MDSNHRRQSQQIYSLSPLATWVLLHIDLPQQTAEDKRYSSRRPGKCQGENGRFSKKSAPPRMRSRRATEDAAEGPRRTQQKGHGGRSGRATGRAQQKGHGGHSRRSREGHRKKGRRGRCRPLRPLCSGRLKFTGCIASPGWRGYPAAPRFGTPGTWRRRCPGR